MTLIQNIEELARAWIKLARSQTRLFLLEAKLARHSIIPLLFAFILLLVVGTCVCIFTLFAIVYGIYLLCHDMFTSIMVVELLGIAGFIIVLKACQLILKQMQFTKTRKHMKKHIEKLQAVPKEALDEQSQQS